MSIDQIHVAAIRELEAANKQWMDTPLWTEESKKARARLDRAARVHEAVIIYRTWTRALEKGWTSIAAAAERRLVVLVFKHPEVDRVFEG